MQKIIFETARDVYDQMKPAGREPRVLWPRSSVWWRRFCRSDRIPDRPCLFSSKMSYAAESS